MESGEHEPGNASRPSRPRVRENSDRQEPQATGDWELDLRGVGARGLHSGPSDSKGSTPEALERIAPGWRGSAYPGFGVGMDTHPEGGAKIGWLQPLQGW